MQSRPAHLRYVQSYAEESLEGEGDSDSDWAGSDDE